MGIPQTGWIRRENHIKMDDFGVSPSIETPILTPNFVGSLMMFEFDSTCSICAQPTSENWPVCEAAIDSTSGLQHSEIS